MRPAEVILVIALEKRMVLRATAAARQMLLLNGLLRGMDNIHISQQY